MTSKMPLFCPVLGSLGSRLDRGTHAALRKEVGVLSTPFCESLIGNAHSCPLLITDLNFKNKTGVEIVVVEKGLGVVDCDVVGHVVLPNCLRALRALDGNVGTQGGLR